MQFVIMATICPSDNQQQQQQQQLNKQLQLNRVWKWISPTPSRATQKYKSENSFSFLRL